MKAKDYQAGEPTPERVRDMREAVGLTQTQAAAVVYVTMRTWQRWEGGDRAMPAAMRELFLLKTGQLTLTDD